MLLQTKTLRVLASRTDEAIELRISALSLYENEVRDENCQTRPLL